MERETILTAGIDTQMLGIEVGPWFSPLVPKQKGYNSLNLDVFSKAELLENAERDPSIGAEASAAIEDVDLVGSATSIEHLVEERGLTGQIDYIISSHNFEHLPNPILFLQGCQRVLRPSGFLTMAIPDRRSCFDFFRPVSTTGDFLESAHRNLVRPSPAMTFDYESLHAKRIVGEDRANGWDPDDDSALVHPVGTVEAAYERYKTEIDPSSDVYVDSHCSVFTRSSFELIIRDLHFLGVIELGIEHIEGPRQHEFFARLSKRVPVPSPSAFQARRSELLHQIIDEIASNSRSMFALKRHPFRSAGLHAARALRQLSDRLRAKPPGR